MPPRGKFTQTAADVEVTVLRVRAGGGWSEGEGGGGGGKSEPPRPRLMVDISLAGDRSRWCTALCCLATVSPFPQRRSRF